mmetsp:Transcript_61723/g.98358  ORF Transcript_61723/g.98358 Transcript_61723/m.98358 type:complete len:256 (-) Transcript_61723:941-1708(-)
MAQRTQDQNKEWRRRRRTHINGSPCHDFYQLASDAHASTIDLREFCAPIYLHRMRADHQNLHVDLPYLPLSAVFDLCSTNTGYFLRHRICTENDAFSHSVYNNLAVFRAIHFLSQLEHPRRSHLTQQQSTMRDALQIRHSVIIWVSLDCNLGYLHFRLLLLTVHLSARSLDCPARRQANQFQIVSARHQILHPLQLFYLLLHFVLSLLIFPAIWLQLLCHRYFPQWLNIDIAASYPQHIVQIHLLRLSFFLCSPL